MSWFLAFESHRSALLFLGKVHQIIKQCTQNCWQCNVVHVHWHAVEGIVEHDCTVGGGSWMWCGVMNFLTRKRFKTLQNIARFPPCYIFSMFHNFLPLLGFAFASRRILNACFLFWSSATLLLVFRFRFSVAFCFEWSVVEFRALWWDDWRSHLSQFSFSSCPRISVGTCCSAITFGIFQVGGSFGPKDRPLCASTNTL